MATGGETRFSCCSSCLEDGTKVMARHYCLECEVYFCAKCFKKCHNIIPSLRNHQVNDVNSSEQDNFDSDTAAQRGSESVDGVKCALHRDKLIDTFCKEHDDVCCGACAVVKHRSCKTVPTDIASKDFKSSPDVQKDKESFAEVVVQCTREMEKRTDNLQSNETEKQELIGEVDQYEERLILKIKEHAENSRQEIRGKYNENKAAIETDVSAIDVIKTTYTEYVDKLDKSDDRDLFIYVKTNSNTMKDDCMLLQTIAADWKERHIQLTIDKTLENHVSEITSLIRLGENERMVTEYQATFQTNVNIRRGQETKNNTSVYGMCLMDNNSIILADYNNNKLKRFDLDFQWKDELSLSQCLFAVCKIDKQEVAVRCENKTVQLVSVGQSMQFRSSFKLDGDGYGMTYDTGTGELFVCEGNKVNVYNRTGNKLRTYDKVNNGEQIFSACKNVALGGNKRDIYVIDQKQGLIVLEKNGTLKTKVAITGINDAFSLCVLPGYTCLLGSYYDSPGIAQIDGTGKEVENIINSKNGRGYAECMVYDSKRSRLLVGGYPGLVSIYTISEK